MFGYVVVDQEHVKDEELQYYRSLYCGLCHTLEEEYGLLARLTLNNDMTCLIALLNGLYDVQVHSQEKRCLVHPLRRHLERISENTYYAARMTILLAYYKALDDIRDDHRHYLRYRLLRESYREVQKAYPYKVKRIEEGLAKINELENQNCQNIDTMCNTFGSVLGEIFACKDDEWHDELYEIGDYIGRFIYLLDAYDDLYQDIKKRSYNPLKSRMNDQTFDQDIRDILVMYMSEATRVMEQLPIVAHTDLLNNIFYSGVWCRFEAIKEKREKDNESL
ncbi:MAG: hypothetical protein J6P61_09945 [Erysipelotrichaceae bacterium]|nr:hypothetical protein [Erysipelotrichaceae bacterium]